jgi:DNA polymerase-1
MAVLTSYAESAASLLAVELELAGLPVHPDTVADLLTDAIGPRPADLEDEAARRAERDTAVLQHFPDERVDLRSPAQVRALLARHGVDLPDTRSWRLEPYAPSMPGVAALLAWRKAERTATTFGWRWLDEQVVDGRVHGVWGSADAAAGRMTAQGGLHSLPAELRSAVRAEPGHVLVRADLGQIEPRVLATVSGDPALAAAAREPDMYTPVAAALRCDRPTAKVAVLAAMYGQTSGTAGAALRDMDRAYPTAMAFLRAAEESGLHRRDVRTYGGRLLRLTSLPAGEPVGEHVAVLGGFGRFARNAVVQGAAAELFKAWAVTVRAGLPELGGQIVLCLHDELLVHVPADGADAAARLLRESLERTASWWAAGSGVRFVAEIGVGDSWADAH